MYVVVIDYLAEPLKILSRFTCCDVSDFIARAPALVPRGPGRMYSYNIVISRHRFVARTAFVTPHR